jgi:peroxiredoxin
MALDRRLIPLAALGLIAGCDDITKPHPLPTPAQSLQDESDPIIKVGTKLPILRFARIDGRTVNLHDLLKGKKGLVLDFWFVDCPPCREEFPHLETLYPTLEKNGFALLGVNRLDSPDKTKRLLKKLHITFPIALNGKGPNECDKALGISGSPTNIVVDATGTVVATFEGENQKGLLSTLTKLGFRG